MDNYELFYDNLILSGTKIPSSFLKFLFQFYDNLILSGTKITDSTFNPFILFYDNLILSGTKMLCGYSNVERSFTIT